MNKQSWDAGAWKVAPLSLFDVKSNGAAATFVKSIDFRKRASGSTKCGVEIIHFQIVDFEENFLQQRYFSVACFW